jgi:Ca2+-binding EF-hand superfamily protein
MIVANKKMLADTKKTGTKKREKAGKDDILEYGAFDLFKVLDIDGDGRITRKEYNAGFDIIDTDRNGFLSKIEFGMASAAPFNLLDQDGNGQLSRKEFKAGFALFDIHGEGFITKEEFNGHLDLFKFLDDGGRISRDECCISRKEYNAGFDKIDADRKGFVTREEFGMSSAAPFNLLDQDGDGQICLKEWKAGGWVGGWVSGWVGGAGRWVDGCGWVICFRNVWRQGMQAVIFLETIQNISSRL